MAPLLMGGLLIVDFRDELKLYFKYDTEGYLIRIMNVGKCEIGDKVGSINSRGYYNVVLNYTIYSLHRLIWIWHYGNIPKDKVIDHIDRDKTNNKIENLRLATVGENAVNQNVRATNKLGILGVCYHKRSKQYRATLKKPDGFYLNKGFKNLEDAVAQRKEWVKFYYDI